MNIMMNITTDQIDIKHKSQPELTDWLNFYRTFAH